MRKLFVAVGNARQTLKTGAKCAVKLYLAFLCHFDIVNTSGPLSASFILRHGNIHRISRYIYDPLRVLDGPATNIPARRRARLCRAITRSNDISSLRRLIAALFNGETSFLLRTKRGGKRSYNLHSRNDLHLGLLRRYYPRLTPSLTGIHPHADLRYEYRWRPYLRERDTTTTRRVFVAHSEHAHNSRRSTWNIYGRDYEDPTTRWSDYI